MKQNIVFLLIALASLCLLTGCELFGLELQQGYDYDPQKGLYDNQLKTDAWEFVREREDLFSELVVAVRYAEIDSAVFNRPNQTLCLPTNAALATATDSYWARHLLDLNEDGIPETKPLSWDVYSKEQVRDLILYHIVIGQWSYYELIGAIQDQQYFFATNSTRADGYVALNIKKEGALSIYFNNFSNHYTADLKARTNNLQVPNGTYIHVLDKYLEYPTEVDLAQYPIYSGK